VILLRHTSQQGIDEFQIAVALFAGLALPAGLAAVGIELARRRQPLRVDHDRLRPVRLERGVVRERAHVAAVPVEREQQRVLAVRHVGRFEDEGFALHAVDVERDDARSGVGARSAK